MQPEYTSRLINDKFSLQYFVTSTEQPVYKRSMFITYTSKVHNIYTNAVTEYRSQEYINRLKTFDSIDVVARTMKCINGKPHNECGPAEIHYNYDGTIARCLYYQYGKLHNVHGPASISYYHGSEVTNVTFYVNNQLHNEHGPAVIDYENGKITHKSYYMNGLKLKMNKTSQSQCNSNTSY